MPCASELLPQSGQQSAQSPSEHLHSTAQLRVPAQEPAWLWMKELLFLNGTHSKINFMTDFPPSTSGISPGAFLKERR